MCSARRTAGRFACGLITRSAVRKGSEPRVGTGRHGGCAVEARENTSRRIPREATVWEEEKEHEGMGAASGHIFSPGFRILAWSASTKRVHLQPRKPGPAGKEG